MSGDKSVILRFLKNFMRINVFLCPSPDPRYPAFSEKLCGSQRFFLFLRPMYPAFLKNSVRVNVFFVLCTTYFYVFLEGNCTRSSFFLCPKMLFCVF